MIRHVLKVIILIETVCLISTTDELVMIKSLGTRTCIGNLTTQYHPWMYEYIITLWTPLQGKIILAWGTFTTLSELYLTNLLAFNNSCALVNKRPVNCHWCSLKLTGTSSPLLICGGSSSINTRRKVCALRDNINLRSCKNLRPLREMLTVRQARSWTTGATLRPAPWSRKGTEPTERGRNDIYNSVQWTARFTITYRSRSVIVARPFGSPADDKAAWPLPIIPKEQI